MNRKIAIVVLIMCLIMLNSLIGCNEKKNLLNDLNDLNDTSKVTLTPAILNFYLAGEEKKDSKEVLGRVTEASNLNIKLNFKWIEFDKYFESIKTGLASNEKIDAFLCGKPIPGIINFVDMFRSGQIKDITELLPKYAPIIFKQFSSGELDAAKVDSKIAFIPPVIPLVDTLGIWVRKDIADKYKISSINSFNDYGMLLKKIKDNKENIVPGTIRGLSNCDINLFANVYGYVVLDYIQALVYKWDDPKMKIIPWEQTPEFKETINFISQWYRDGYMENVSGKEELASFMCRATQFREGPSEIDVNNDGNKKTYNYYMLYKDKKMQRKSPTSFYDCSSIAFNSNSENIERTLMFLNWIQSSQKNYDLFNNGIIGKHYILKGDRIDMPEGMKVNENPYYGWYNLPFLNINFMRLSVDDHVPDSEWADTVKFLNSNASYAPHEGFYADYKNIQADYDRRMKLYQEKIINALGSGTFDINKTDSIIEDLKNAGTYSVVNETQKQLDKFRSLNNK